MLSNGTLQNNYLILYAVLNYKFKSCVLKICNVLKMNNDDDDNDDDDDDDDRTKNKITRLVK